MPAHRVVTLIGPKVSMFELSLACEVFGLDRSELVDPWDRHRVAAAIPGPHRSPEGVCLETPYGLAAPARPAGPAAPGDHRRAGRAGGPALGLRVRRRPTPALQPDRLGLPGGLPAGLPVLTLDHILPA